MDTGKKEDKLKLIESESQAFNLAKTLEQKLDFAFAIYIATDELISSLPGEDEDKERVKKLQEAAVTFMKDLLTVKDNDRMVMLAEKRKKMKEFDPAYLPRGDEVVGVGDVESRALYNWERLVLLMLALEERKIMKVDVEERLSDIDDKISYLNYEQRAKHRVVLKDGKFYEPSSGVEFGKNEQFELCDTGLMESHEKSGYAAYVINAKGEISIFDHYEEADNYRHSSMNAGAPVLGAGEVKIDNGELKEITTHSGHYLPSLENVGRVLMYFREQGVNIDDVKVRGFYPHTVIPFSEDSTGGGRYIFKAPDIVNKMGYLVMEGRARAKIETVNSLMGSLDQEVESLIEDLELYSNKLKGRGKLDDVFRAAQHLVRFGKGSYYEMKKENIKTLGEIIGDLTELRNDIAFFKQSNKEKYKIVSIGKEGLKRIFATDIQKSALDIKDKLEGHIKGVQGKYTAKGKKAPLAWLKARAKVLDKMKKPSSEEPPKGESLKLRS
jgi:hypothetical protein